MRSCVLLVAAVVLWAALLPAVLACDCCERNATLSECGPGSELRSRPDCDCCTACARLRDQSCNDSDQPCAEGLDCSSERVCTDPEKCRSDGDCHESRFCLGGVCTDPCQVLDHCDGLLRHGACQVRNHRPVCTCPPTLTLDAEKKACVKGPGCQTDDGKQLSSGEKTARSNCSETCLCEANGTLSCTPTQCPPGLYVSGAFADDPSCVELKSSNADPCCVSVVCPDEPSSEEQKGATEAPAAPTTTEPDPTTPPGAETATAPDAALDVLPLSITHNSTQLQLPSTGGRLTYRADGRPPVTVNGTEQLDRVTVTGLLPGTGYVFTWVGPAGNKKLRVDTRPGCVTNTTSYGVGETYHMGCQSTCVCGGPNQPACRPRCSVARGTVTDPLCSERPDPADPECCVELVCAASSPADEILAEEPETTELPSTTTSSSTTESTTTSAEPSTTTTEDTPSSSPSTEPSLPKPSLIVTARSHSAVTLAWDDFQPPQYAQGYVLQYRRTGGDYPWQRRELPPQRGQTVPLAKVDGLMPGTEYEARVSLHADNDPDALGDSTETTRFTTDDGCVEGEKSYAVGEKFSRGCEESCTCELKGRVQCAPRCPPPLFRAGHFSADPLCKETALDDCCVTAVCDTAPLDEHHQQGADGVDQCEFVHCGPNSQCEMMKAASSGGEADSMEARCICAPGFTQSWDKPDTCVKDSGNVILNRTGCEYDGMLYTPGDEFFKSCEYRCRCSVKNQVECKPRCKVDQSTMLDLPAGCVRVHEPEPNQHCCMELKCDNATSAEESTSEGPFMEDPLEGESISTRFGAARLDPASSDLRIVGLDAVDAGSTSVRVEVPEAVARELSGSLKEAPVTVQWRYIGDGAWESRTVPHRLLHLGDRLLTMLVTGFGRPGDAILKVSLNGETSAEVRGADLLSEQDGGKMNEEHTGANHEQPTGQEPAADTAEPIPDEGFDCVFNGTSYKIGDEFHDGCRQFCLCTSTGVSCAAIECPHHFGLKLINPDCLEWSHPEDFHPTPPNCCPEVTCIDDGSCQFRGETFRNLEKLPEKLTGCDVCYCEFGNVTCQSSCAPVPATPPRELPCSPDQITLGPGPNGCCKLWQCSDDETANKTTGQTDTTDVDSTTGDELDTSTSPDNVQTTEPSIETLTDNPIPHDLEHLTHDNVTQTEMPSSNDSEEPTLEPETTPEPEPSPPAPVDPEATESLTSTDDVANLGEAIPNEETSEATLLKGKLTTEGTVEPASESSDVTKAQEPAQETEEIPVSNNEALEDVSTGNEDTDASSEPGNRPNKIVVIDGERYLDSNGKLYPLPSLPNFVRPSNAQRPVKPFRPQPGQQPPRPVPQRPLPSNEESNPGKRPDGIGGVPPPRRPPVPPEESNDEEDEPSVVVIDGKRFLESGGKLFPLPGVPSVTDQEQDQQTSGAPQPGARPIQPGKNVPPSQGFRPPQGGHPGSLGLPGQGRHPAIGGHPAAQGGRPGLGVFPDTGGRPGPGRRPVRPNGPGARPILVGPNGERIRLGPDGRPLRPTASSGRPGSPGRRPVFVPHSQESPEIIILPDGRRVQVFPDGSTRPLSRPTSSQRPQEHLIAIGPDGQPILGPDGRPITIPTSAARRPIGGNRPTPLHQQLQQQNVHPLRRPRPPSRGESAGESLGNFSPGDRIPIDNRGRPIPVGPNGPVRTPVFDIIIGDDGRPITDDDGRTMLFPVHGGAGGGPSPHRDQEPDDATLLLQHLATSTPPPEREQHLGQHKEGNDIDNLRVRDVKPNSVQFSFSIPPALVGLPGRTEVLYTDNPSFGAESTDWDRRVFQTPSGLLDRTDFVWTLGDLRPATTYLMQAKVVFEQVSTILQSSIVEFRTRDPPEPEVALPPKVELDAELQELEVDTNSAEIQWRRLSDQELNYVDGIQLRYRDVDVDAQVWTMTPFIHRELTSYRLTDLKPDTTYEVDIVLMPFTDKHTEMVSSHSIQIHTQAVVDRYAFNVSLTNVEPGPTSVRVNWTGVPKPQYQFVNVYRIVYIYEKEREEKHTFKLAKTSESPSVLIKGLKPSSKYQVWLEAYLKNGKKQVSEVREFVTKPGPIGKAEEIRVDAAGFGGKLQPSDDYYGGMVAAAIIATIAILLCLFLAFLLVRRPPKPAEPTTPARKNGPSYENPAFKPTEATDSASSEGGSTTITT
ncbi:uncharacterized protein LOC122388618 isoform X3 [Amphibalanus amphitrite]|uniref:uncharacterized protein LOC122388618 isoform X3 n=1 Tax=Amphibalanus amphitrite TaxID=1232801 RepID=UPI001C913C9A|nr:uncharacterized protein LOC122388618 isoform X3 [Amphibalanus amphitrite]